MIARAARKGKKMITSAECAKGKESYETFNMSGKSYVQYDYRAPDGELFSCVKRNVRFCREARNRWLLQKERICK